MEQSLFPTRMMVSLTLSLRTFHPKKEVHFSHIMFLVMTDMSCLQVGFRIQKTDILRQSSFQRPERRPHYTRQGSNLSLQPTITCASDTRISKVLRLRQRLTPSLEGTLHLFLAENHGLRFSGTGSHLALNCLITYWGSCTKCPQDNIICKNKR